LIVHCVFPFTDLRSIRLQKYCLQDGNTLVLFEEQGKPVSPSSGRGNGFECGRMAVVGWNLSFRATGRAAFCSPERYFLRPAQGMVVKRFAENDAPAGRGP
jgi:hypothetical protein